MPHGAPHGAYPAQPGYPAGSYPMGQAPPPGQGYPGQVPGYPGQAPGYPGQAPGYPGQAPGYPHPPNPSYPAGATGYPAAGSGGKSFLSYIVFLHDIIDIDKYMCSNLSDKSMFYGVTQNRIVCTN